MPLPSLTPCQLYLEDRYSTLEAQTVKTGKWFSTMGLTGEIKANGCEAVRQVDEVYLHCPGALGRCNLRWM